MLVTIDMRKNSLETDQATPAFLAFDVYANPDATPMSFEEVVSTPLAFAK